MGINFETDASFETRSTTTEKPFGTGHNLHLNRYDGLSYGLVGNFVDDTISDVARKTEYIKHIDRKRRKERMSLDKASFRDDSLSGLYKFDKEKRK